MNATKKTSNATIAAKATKVTSATSATSATNAALGYASFFRRVASKRNNLIKLCVITIDLALVIVSYFIAFLVRFAGEIPAYNTKPFLVALPFITLTFLIYADFFGLLKFYRRSLRQVVASILKLVFMQALTTTTITYFLEGYSFPRTVLLGSAVIQAILLTLWNWFMISVRDHFTNTSIAMAVGSADDIKALREQISDLVKTEKIILKYTFSPDQKDMSIDAIKTLHVDEVFLCAGLSADLKMNILLLCMNLRKVVFLVPELFELAQLNARVINLDDTPLILLDRMSLSFEQRFFKRSFDLIATLLALPLLFPFLTLVAIGVKLSSPGKFFYSQERVTGGGKIFKIYKFRTMFDGAENLTGPVISYENDTRVTSFGRFLRRFHIDEFPQLINVLKGEISLVGPRSERPFFTERFNRNIDGYTIRNNVKAGLTGYAQIYGNYDTEAGAKLKYDILYIKNYSLLLDIKLIFKTFHIILRKQQREMPAKKSTKQR